MIKTFSLCYTFCKFNLSASEAPAASTPLAGQDGATPSRAGRGRGRGRGSAANIKKDGVTRMGSNTYFYTGPKAKREAMEAESEATEEEEEEGDKDEEMPSVGPDEDHFADVADNSQVISQESSFCKLAPFRTW